MTTPRDESPAHPVSQINWWADAYEREGGHGLIVQMLRAYAALAAPPVVTVPADQVRDERGAFEAWALMKWGREAWRHVSPTSGEWGSMERCTRVPAMSARDWIDLALIVAIVLLLVFLGGGEGMHEAIANANASLPTGIVRPNATNLRMVGPLEVRADDEKEHVAQQ